MNGEIPKILSCPACGEAVSGFESECPKCRKRFDASVKFDCPFCGESVIAGSISCPSCHVDFEEVIPNIVGKPPVKSVEQLLDELGDYGSGRKSGAPPARSCPKCGSRLPQGIEKCAICGTVIAKPSAEVKPPLPKPTPPPPKFEVPSSLTKLMEEEKPKVVWSCPKCGKPVGEDELACPHCKTVFEPVDETATKAPEKNGEEEAIAKLTGLLDLVGQQAPKTRKLKSRPEKVASLSSKVPPREMVSAIGRVNGTGLVNGRGAVNGRGLVNGKGAINGKGLASTRGQTNGKSISRGTEFVNGTGVSNGIRPSRSSRFVFGGTKKMLLKWQFITVIMVIVIVISVFVYLSYNKDSAPYSVDGNLNDWNHATAYSAAVVSSATGTVVDRWSFDSFGSSLYFFVRTQGPMMNTGEVESILLYVDEDGSASTGYTVEGIGADLLITVDGWNGSVQATSVSRYSSQSDHLNWSAWSNFGSVDHAKTSNELEASALLDDPVDSSAKALLVYKDELERVSASQPVPEQGSLLIVTQELAPSLVSTGVIGSSSSSQLLRLTFTCEGSGGSVDSVVPDVVGGTLAGQIQSFNLDPGGRVVRNVSVDTSSATPGQMVSALVGGSSISSTFDAVQVVGAGAKAYVQSVPGSVVIDGAFGDWTNFTSVDSDSIPVSARSVDIDEVGGQNDSESAFFYVSVKGDIFEGSFAPMKLSKPSGGGGGSVIPTRKTAEDITRIFIDVDSSSSTGYGLSYESKSIGADSMVEVRGLFGKIVSAVQYNYSAGIWTAASSSVEAMNDDKRLEVGVSASSLGGVSSVDFIIETTSWDSRGDYAVYDPSAAIASIQYLSLPPDFERWAVESPTGSSAATAMSYQRKLFYDGTNFWSVYFDGANTVYKYSTNGGQTWTSRGSLFKTSGVDEASIWYDSTNKIVYAVGDTSTASRNVYVQRGVVTPATSSISWASTDSTPSISTNSLGGKNAFVSKDVSGYIWVLATDLTLVSPARYDLTSFKSRNADSLNNWDSMGSMGCAATQSTLKGTILPAGTGSNMWAVYIFDGNISSRKYTGSWSGSSSIYTSTGSAGYVDVAPPSAVVDSRGVIHVVYGDGHENPVGTVKPFIQYTYNNSGSWSSALRLDSVANNKGNRYPTLSLDSSTGNLYVFWIQIDTMAIYCSKNASGTWSQVSLGTQTSYAKQYLTSIYSAPGEQFICWQWTQNTSAPMEVQYDKLPEFPGIVLPVISIVALFLFVNSRSRPKKARHP